MTTLTYSFKSNPKSAKHALFYAPEICALSSEGAKDDQHNLVAAGHE
jgi:hypothetical protein